MAAIEHPFHPIIYVRGYAMTPGEIAETVATPYMGFNLGSTKIRQDWRGKVVRHIFESPLVRLMKEHGYKDIYLDGAEITKRIQPKSVIIYRYYEQADKDLGSGKVPSIVEAAKGLGELIRRVQEQVCGTDKAALAAFKVYLVAHSMGGLVCRCFLQNDAVSTPADRALVDKVFTYATPHNGIDVLGMNVPSGLDWMDLNNFSRENMAKYLGLRKGAERVDSLDGKFDPNRFFCLVGTNHKDYDAAFGAARRLAGELSDGLVKIENAAVQGAPRAFVYRSHSGHYGIVNSEEGYQNLKRFLFGDLRVDGRLDVEALPLPPSIEQARKEGKEVRGSYYFEATVSPRGAFTYKLTERRTETNSAVLRRFDELLRLEKVQRKEPRSPMLFSAYLSQGEIVSGQTFVFTIDLGVSTTGYTIDGILWDRHIPGEYLFRNTVVVRATHRNDKWSVRYAFIDDAWGEHPGHEAERSDDGFAIPLSSGKGFKATLRLVASPWND